MFVGPPNRVYIVKVACDLMDNLQVYRAKNSFTVSPLSFNPLQMGSGWPRSQSDQHLNQQQQQQSVQKATINQSMTINRTINL